MSARTFGQRSRFLLLLSCLAAGAVSDAPTIRALGNGVYSFTHVPSGSDLTATPESPTLLNGSWRREWDLTALGDRGVVYRSVADPAQSVVIPPEYETAFAPPPSLPVKKSVAPDSSKVCLSQSEGEIPELPESGTPAESSPPTPPLPNYREIADHAEDADRSLLLEGAREIVLRYQEDADEDVRTLTTAFRELSPTERQAAFHRAADELRRQAADFEQADRSTMLPGERIRFRNSLANALDKAEAATRSEIPDALPSLQPQAATSKSAGVTPDALTDRMVLLNAFAPEQREKLLSRLRLVETPTLTLKNGKKSRFAIPHNGYWLGGSRTGTDCSGLASEALPAEVRQLRFTTLDFRTIYQLARKGRYTPPPRYDEERLGRLREVAANFEAVQPHLGETLKPFDLLVYRLGAEPIGHVFIVEKFDPKTLDAQVLEASQSYGGLRSRSFNLSLDPRDAPHRILRPGLFALRLKKEAVARKCALEHRSQPKKDARS